VKSNNFDYDFDASNVTVQLGVSLKQLDVASEG
jgi:hypothetical protein